MPQTQMERIWAIGAAFAAFILLVIGYLFFISPQRDHTSQVNSQVATAQQQNDTLAARISALSAQNKNLATYENAVKRADAALPATSGLSDFLRTLQAIGNATLAKVEMLNVGQPAPFVNPVVAAAAPAGSATPSTASSTPPAGPVVAAAPSIYVMQVSAQVTGSQAQLSEFLRQLQSVQPRAVLINQITENVASPGAASHANNSATTGTSLQLQMSVFVQPGGAAGGLPTGTP